MDTTKVHDITLVELNLMVLAIIILTGDNLKGKNACSRDHCISIGEMEIFTQFMICNGVLFVEESFFPPVLNRLYLWELFPAFTEHCSRVQAVKENVIGCT